MKYYEDVYLAQKVKMIHAELEKIDFPYHIKAEKNEDAHILKQRWFEGRSADFKYSHDQKAAIHALQELHNSGKYIDWQEKNILPYYELREKWTRRFERFIENEEELKRLLQANYERILMQAFDALKAIEQNEKNKVDTEQRTLLHGDVVHHNFMIEEDVVKLVDFDLAALGKRSDELILWLHRVLPNVQYDIRMLIKTHPYLEQAAHKLHYLRFPNEIMREALFYLKLNERQRNACFPFIQSIVTEWQKNEKSLSKAITSLQ